MRTISAVFGSLSSTTSLPIALESLAMSSSTNSDCEFSCNSISTGNFRLMRSGTLTCNHRATVVSVVPCNNTDDTEIKNTILNIVCACVTPASSGYVAKMIGTAPRNPTQDMNTFFLKLIRRTKMKDMNTAVGLSTNYRMSDMRRHSWMTSMISQGDTSKPSV